MIPRCAVWLPLATSQVQAVRFTDLRCFIPAAFYDRILHEDRLALPTGGITIQELSPH